MMIRRNLVHAITVWAALISGIAIASEAIDPQKFVVGWPLELPSQEAFYDVPITSEVYQHGRSLSELAILDANGKPMPFYRVTVPSPIASENQTTLGVSPIYVQQDDLSGADLSITTQGGKTDVVVTRSADEAPTPEVTAFIVDAREVEGTPVAIELSWETLDRPFMMTVSIDHSDDLTLWRRVGSGSVASLAIDGATVTHGRIEISGRQGGYYRLQWNRQVSDWWLNSVVLTTSALTTRATFDEVTLSPISTPTDDPQEISLYFDVGGALPTTSVDLVLPGGNRWANASIQSGPSPDGPWRPVVSRQLFYDIKFEGERLSSEAVSLRRAETRYWKVVFSSKSQANGVQLRLDYPEEKLRFSADGVPPYQLVGGTLLDEAGPDSTFAAVMNTLDPETSNVTEAKLGGRTTLGGLAALEIPTEFPWRTIILWLVLLVAVLVIGYMVVRLARDMFTEKT
ncbi:MAG: DUF3999 domain-containing protein [Gammaproteobacteria bacterium]|nr:DUF3999 domain-containing protein [Gammaproteobacteria bacterium]